MLIERNLLRVLQRRIGPIIVRTMRLLQCLIDGLKLFTKKVLFLVWFTTLYLLLFASTLFFELENINNLLLLMLLLSTVFLANFYTYLNSIYIYISLMRNRLMVLVFDFTFFFTLFIFIFMTTGNLYILLTLLIVAAAELGRVPVDILERESEIVSRTNIEFSGVSFTFIFLYEYFMILLFCVLLGVVIHTTSFVLFTLILLFFRNVLPRYTIYDLIYFILRFLNMVIFIFYFMV